MKAFRATASTCLAAIFLTAMITGAVQAATVSYGVQIEWNTAQPGGPNSPAATLHTDFAIWIHPSTPDDVKITGIKLDLSGAPDAIFSTGGGDFAETDFTGKGVHGIDTDNANQGFNNDGAFAGDMWTGSFSSFDRNPDGDGWGARFTVGDSGGLQVRDGDMAGALFTYSFAVNNAAMTPVDDLLLGFGLGSCSGNTNCFEKKLSGNGVSFPHEGFLENITVIPLPAAIWFLASALFGLFGLGYVRNRA